MNHFNVHKATKADKWILLQMLEQARKYKLSLGDNAWGYHPFTEEDVELRLKSNTCFVAEVHNKPIGSITLLWEDKHNWGDLGNDGTAGYIHGLMIIDKYRGQGLGRQLIEWAAKETKKHGRNFLRLDCHSDNIGLCNYYERLGFKKVSSNTRTTFYQRAI